MPRDLRSIDPSASQVAAFAVELRKLYEDAGRPKFLQMARKTGKSRTALSEAVGGDHLPTWETVSAFVLGCGGNPDDWRSRWEQVRSSNTSGRLQSENSYDVEQAPVAEMPVAQAEMDQAIWVDNRGKFTKRTLIWCAVTALASTILASVSTSLFINSSDATAAGQSQPPKRRVIQVQNKVALGASDLIEDTTTAYLSSVPQPFCARKGCKVVGTDVASDALLVAMCFVHGVEMFNYNLDSSESVRNPHRVRSKLWYRAIFPNGLSGYISEVYIVPEDRGGLSLQVCGPE